jgi:DUF4097 and DUF4098 domain-containing protein YvlB
MSNTSSLSKNIGKLLIFLGVLWICFRYIDVYALPSYTGPLLLIAGGAMIIVSTLARRTAKSAAVVEILSVVNIIILSIIVAVGISFLVSFSGYIRGPYTARVEKNIQVEIGSVNLVELTLGTVSGDIVVKSCEEPRFDIKITVEAGGISESAAESFAKRILEEVDFRKEVSSSGVLSVQVSTKPRTWGWLSNYMIHIEATVYKDMKINVNTDTVSGDTFVTGLSGERLSIGSISGEIRLNSTSESVKISLVSGDLDGSLNLRSLDISVVSGSVDLKLTPSGAGSYVASTVSGDVKLTLTTGENIGYRISCSTVSGSINILNIPDMTVLSKENRSEEVVTSNYDEKDIKVTVSVSAISGNIRISGK